MSLHGDSGAVKGLADERRKRDQAINGEVRPRPGAEGL
jgi:hypothetical protein